MTIEFRSFFNQLVCKWDVPKTVNYMGKEVQINRQIMRRIQLSPRGEIIPGQAHKLGGKRRWNELVEQWESMKPEFML